jgi:hypothetical protein
MDCGEAEVELGIVKTIMANKAPEPTPTAVTSRADRFSDCTTVRKARLAPAVVVAHL